MVWYKGQLFYRRAKGRGWSPLWCLCVYDPAPNRLKRHRQNVSFRDVLSVRSKAWATRMWIFFKTHFFFSVWAVQPHANGVFGTPFRRFSETHKKVDILEISVYIYTCGHAIRRFERHHPSRACPLLLVYAFHTEHAHELMVEEINNIRGESHRVFGEIP